MKRQKLVFAVLVVLFIVIFSAAVTTLSLSAIDDSMSDHDGGKWEYVCCGTGCAGGTDYCLGNGTYICCK